MVPSMVIASTASCLTCINIGMVPSIAIASTANCLNCIGICMVPSMVIDMKDICTVDSIALAMVTVQAQNSLYVVAFQGPVTKTKGEAQREEEKQPVTKTKGEAQREEEKQTPRTKTWHSEACKSQRQNSQRWNSEAWPIWKRW